MATKRTNRKGDRPESVSKQPDEGASGEASPENPENPQVGGYSGTGPGPVLSLSPDSRPVNPQEGHEGQVGYTEPVACPNCGNTGELKVLGGKLVCPNCPLREDATGLRLSVRWEDRP